MVTGPSLRRAQAIRLNARREWQIMKVVSLQLALAAAILAIVFSGVGRAHGTYRASRHPHRQEGRNYREAPAGARSLQAKIHYCYDCHGSSGQGYRGFFPMPRLAGQTTEYTENQLRAFVEGRRESHIAIVMSKVHGLSPEMRAALATHFRDLNSKPFGSAPRELVATGKKIYEEGIPDANVPACSACHGPEAKGSAAIPRLAGQLYPYTVKELVNWGTERGQNPATSDTSAVMQPIARSLTKSQTEAVAAYLGYLE
jgi:cytochrome c553